MPWFNVDDGFANSKPVLRIPRRYRCAAIGLWTLAGSWSAKELTDGFIPDHAIEEFAGTPQIAEHLVRAGLWRKTEDGWQFEGWAKWQKTKEKVLAYREREAEKKRTQRSGPKPAGSESVSPGDSLGTETNVPQGQDGESPMCPGQPLPTPLPTPKSSVETLGGGVTSVDANGSPRPHCPNHAENYDGPCRKCKRRREWDEEHEAEIQRDQLEAKRRLKDAAKLCPRCQGTNTYTVGEGFSAKCDPHLPPAREEASGE